MNNTESPNCVLAETQIVELDGIIVSVPVRVVESYVPKQSFYIEGQDLPVVFLDQKFHSIKLASGSATLTVLLGSYSIDRHLKTGKLYGKLFLNRTPCAAIAENTQLQSATFRVFNFPAFHSQPAKVIEENSRVRFEGITEFVANRFRVEIEPLGDIRAREEQAKKDDALHQSHSGTVHAISANTFSVGDLLRLLNDISRFLSFLRRDRVGVNTVMGVDVSGASRIVRWGMEHVAPGVTLQHQFLLSPISAGNDMDDIFPGFYREVMSSYGDTVRFAMDLYIEGNSANFLMGIPNAQSALEALVRLYCPWQGATKTISKALKDKGIPLDVPNDFAALQQFVSSKQCSNGLVGFVKLRNILIHSAKDVYKIPDFAFLDACELGQWFIEMLLLHMFDYHGRYRSRLVRNHDVTPYAHVPWGT